MTASASKQDLQSLHQVANELLRLTYPEEYWRSVEEAPYPYQERLVSDHAPRIAVKAARQTGKSTAAAIKAAHSALTPNHTILLVSPSQKQSTEIFRKIKKYMKLGGVKPVRDTLTDMELPNGSRIVSLPASEHTIRGYTANMLIVDEAAFVPDELFDAIIPSLAATQGSLILLSTPFGKSNYFYNAWFDPQFSHHEFSASDCPHYTDEFLASEQARMSQLAYRQEYLAEFVEDASAVFRHSLIMSSIWAQLDTDEGRYFCGVDLAKHVDWTVFTVLKFVNGKNYMVHCESHQKEPYPLITQKLKALHERYHFSKVVVDATGVGDAVVDTLRWDANLPLEPFVFTQHTKVNLIENLKVQLEHGTLKLMQHQRTLTELSAFEYQVGKSNIKYGTQSEHDDHVVALALATWGISKGISGGFEPSAYAGLVFGGKV